MRRPDITAVVTAHDEGPLVVPALRSLHDAVDEARAAGLVVETLGLLDTADPATRAAFEQVGGLEEVVEVAFADHGAVRNAAVERARGAYVAFLDGDDLWSRNWLVAAHRVCAEEPGRVIAHPHLDWIFGDDDYRGFQPDQMDPAFTVASLRVANPWDQLCMAPREVHEQHPYRVRDLESGFAYLDWTWNLETVAAGLVHRAVPETIHFKRRRASSRLAEARANRSLPFPSPVHSYAWWADIDHLGG